MSESNLADAAGDEQETGIQVNMDATDDGKAVTRARPRSAAPPRKDWAQERADTSKEVKKRIARIENRFNQQMAEREAEHQRQLAEINAKFDRLGKGSEATGTDDAAHEKAMEAMQTELEEAQERGDSKAVAAITRKMSAADAKYWATKTSKQTQGASDNGARGDGTRQQPAADPTQRKPTKAGVEWAKANGEWWNDTVDETACDAREYANAIHKRMLADGEHDPETPEYFEIIRQQVARRFPEIETKSTVKSRRREAEIDDEDEEGERQPVRRAAGMQLPNRGAAPRTSELRTLTRADIKTMRDVGMNPDNDKHVVQFLRSKQETEADA